MTVAGSLPQALSRARRAPRQSFGRTNKDGLGNRRCERVRPRSFYPTVALRAVGSIRVFGPPPSCDRVSRSIASRPGSTRRRTRSTLANPPRAGRCSRATMRAAKGERPSRFRQHVQLRGRFRRSTRHRSRFQVAPERRPHVRAPKRSPHRPSETSGLQGRHRLCRTTPPTPVHQYGDSVGANACRYPRLLGTDGRCRRLVGVSPVRDGGMRLGPHRRSVG